MNYSILGRFAASEPSSIRAQFYPASTSEFFALRLALKLDDALAVGHYIALLNRYGPGTLLTAYRDAIDSQAVGPELARVYHRQLAELNNRAAPIRTQRVIAIRVERRTVAVAVLKNVQLEFAKARQLSSFGGKALASAAHFFERVLEDYPATSVVFESIPTSKEGQRQQIVRVIEDILRSREAVVSSIHRSEVLHAFGNPPLRSRKQLREVIRSIWPVLDLESGAECVADAAGLGLYVQTECLFNT